MHVIRSLLFYLVFYVGTLPFLLVALPVGRFAPTRMRNVATLWSNFHRWCARWLAGITVREVGHRPSAPALYAFRHESFFEAIDLPTSLRMPVIFAKEELFAIPAWGPAARAYGAIPVARQDGAKALRSMMSEARRLAAEGRPLAIFPEGTRVPHGQQAPLKSGFMGIYKLLGLPVVPVAVNSGPIYQCRWKRPGTITIKFGHPIEPGLPRDEVERRVLAAINALNS